MNYLHTETNRELSKLMAEEWKPVKGYEGLYEVSNHGRVKSMKRTGNNKTRIKSLWVGDCIVVVLSKDGKPKTHRVHGLVANAWIPNPNSYRLVNHKNGNKHDNSLGNLEWCNHSMNNKHAYQMGRKNQKGEHNGNHKLDEITVRFIRYSKKIAPWVSDKDLARAYGISLSQIRNIISYSNWKDV